MSISKIEIEQLINLFSFTNSTLNKKFNAHQDTYKLLITKSQTSKINCSIFLKEEIDLKYLTKINKEIKDFQSISHNERTKENQWKNISLSIEINKEKEKIYTNLKNLNGESVKFEYSNSLNELIFHFDEGIFNKENISHLILIFQYLNTHKDKIQKKLLIKLIIDYQELSNDITTEIESLFKNKAIQQFTNILNIFLCKVDNTNNNIYQLKKNLPY